MPPNPPPKTAMRMSRRNAQALGSLHVIARWSFDALVGRRYRQSGGRDFHQLVAHNKSRFFVSSSHGFVPQISGTMFRFLPHVKLGWLSRQILEPPLSINFDKKGREE